jgi:hypothetical protein
VGQEHIDLRRDQFGRESGKAIVISLGKLIVDGNIFSLFVAEWRKPFSRASISRVYSACEVTPR